MKLNTQKLSSIVAHCNSKNITISFNLSTCKKGVYDSSSIILSKVDKLSASNNPLYVTKSNERRFANARHTQLTAHRDDAPVSLYTGTECYRGKLSTTVDLAFYNDQIIGIARYKYVASGQETRFAFAMQTCKASKNGNTHYKASNIDLTHKDSSFLSNVKMSSLEAKSSDKLTELLISMNDNDQLGVDISEDMQALESFFKARPDLFDRLAASINSDSNERTIIESEDNIEVNENLESDECEVSETKSEYQQIFANHEDIEQQDETPSAPDCIEKQSSIDDIGDSGSNDFDLSVYLDNYKSSYSFDYSKYITSDETEYHL